MPRKAPNLGTPLKGLVRVDNLTEKPGPHCGTCPLRRCGHVPPLRKDQLDSSILFVGEAPGPDEETKGRAFVGPAGKVLDKAIDRATQQSGMANAYLARVNSVACRPPNNRTPTPLELAACRPVLERQLQLTSATVVVPLGGTALHSVAGLLKHSKQKDEKTGKMQDAYSGIKGWRGYVIQPDERPHEFVLGSVRGMFDKYKTDKRHPDWRKMLAANPEWDRNDPRTYVYRKDDPKEGKKTIPARQLALSPTIKWIMPSLHPAYVMKGFKEMPALVADIKKAFRLNWGEKPLLNEPDIAYTWTEAMLKGMTPERVPPGAVVGFDIETYQLEPAHGSIERISFAWEKERAVTLPWNRATHEFAQQILGRQDVTVIGHNVVGFDVPHLAANGVEVRAPLHDTLIAGQMCNPDMPKSLNYVSSLEWIMSRWKHLNKDRPAFYNALDSERLLWLWEVQVKELTETNQWEHYINVIAPGLSTLAAMTQHGVRIDEEVYEAWRQRLKKHLLVLGQLWYTLEQDANPSSPQQLQAVFSRILKSPVKSVDKHLLGRLKKPGEYGGKWYERGVPQAKILSRYRKVERQITYYASTKYYRRSKDSTLRIHPNYVPLAKDDENRESRILTATGRRATKNPNAQNWPEYARQIIIPDSDDLVFWEADHSQIEAWLTAIECQDEVMLDVLYSNEKLHNWALDQLREIDPHISYHTAKRVVHGTNYLMGWKTMMQTLHDDEVYVDAATTKAFIQLLRDRLPGRTRWHRSVVEEARMFGYLANAFGRRRKFHCNSRGELENAAAAVAFRPASNMADIMWHHLRDLPGVLAPFGARVLGDNHDSVYGQAPKRRWQQALRALMRVMERPFPQITGVEWEWWCPVEVKVGPNWRDLEDRTQEILEAA